MKGEEFSLHASLKLHRVIVLLDIGLVQKQQQQQQQLVRARYLLLVNLPLALA